MRTNDPPTSGFERTTAPPLWISARRCFGSTTSRTIIPVPSCPTIARPLARVKLLDHQSGFAIHHDAVIGHPRQLHASVGQIVVDNNSTGASVRRIACLHGKAARAPLRDQGDTHEDAQPHWSMHCDRTLPWLRESPRLDQQPRRRCLSHRTAARRTECCRTELDHFPSINDSEDYIWFEGFQTPALPAPHPSPFRRPERDSRWGPYNTHPAPAT